MRQPIIKLILANIFFISISFASTCGSANDSIRKNISLNGANWKLIGLEFGKGEKLGINKEAFQPKELISTTVPNNVQLAIGLNDPYSQDKEVVEINRKEWWYVRSFPSPEVGKQQHVKLVFDGVDYFADVWLNGEKLGSHEGAFTGFGFDITASLHSGSDNYLAIRVTAPWKTEGRSHYEFMKGEYDETWDALPGPGQVTFPLGLHRSVGLEVKPSTNIEALRVSTEKIENDGAKLKLQVSVASTGLPKKYQLKVAIRPENFKGKQLNLPEKTISIADKAAEEQIIDLVADIEHAKLWWTWDKGAQNLYIAEATLTDQSGTIVDKLSTVFGIRTFERDKAVVYKLNGQSLFLRGAWYPFSKLFHSEPTRWDYEKDLLQARHANMNHIVNFSIMEKKDFYELADRMGMLVFVELPFNQLGPLDALNNKYPRKEEYLKWCSGEVARIVRTWSNHPSIALWCPVAEITSDGSDFTNHFDFRVREATKGYAGFLKKMEEVVKVNDPDALYFPSFCDFGEKHFWYGGLGGTYENQFDSKKELISEYGGMSFFPYETLSKIVDPQKIWNNSQKPWSALKLPVDLGELSYLTGFSYAGLVIGTEYIYKNTDQHTRSLKEFTYATMIYQDFIYGYAADAYRRKLCNPVNGIRSWSFKDFTPKPLCGFGVIDCNNTPMPSYYTQKRTFDPVSMSFAVRYALGSYLAGSNFEITLWISNATNETLTGTAEAGLYSLNGELVK